MDAKKSAKIYTKFEAASGIMHISGPQVGSCKHFILMFKIAALEPLKVYWKE
jgi:hypothetical protein